jgi:hypothetical protein
MEGGVLGKAAIVYKGLRRLALDPDLTQLFRDLMGFAKMGAQTALTVM